MTNQFSWSISALSLYETCPKQYFHLRVRKDIKSAPATGVQEYGRTGHNVIDQYIKKGKELPLDFQYMEKYIKPYRELVGHKKVTVLTEQKLAINESFEPTGWFDSDCWCRAVMDVSVIGDKSATVVDWKFGKPKDNEDQLFLMAAILMLHQKRLDRVHTGFLWFKTKDKTSRTIHRKDIPKFWAEILPRVNRMKNAIRTTDFPAQPSGLCRGWCPVKSCPHYEER